MAAPLIAVRGSSGVALYRGGEDFGECGLFQRDPTRNCRCMGFSRDGSTFAWSGENGVRVVSTANFETSFEVARPRTQLLAFSPLGAVLCLWELHAVSKDHPEDHANLHLYDVETGTCLRSFVQRQQTSWQPRWSDDERICARRVNNEVHVFESNKFETTAGKIHLPKLAEFSVAPGPPPHHVACLVPGTKGQPSFVRIFRHPNFDGAGVANKSFYKADRVEFFWNQKGKGLLLLTSTDVDKTGGSYYGDQGLYFLSTSGDAATVKRNKDGPVYGVAWSPRCDHFCVVYGYMPAKAALFNLDCDPIFEMGTGPRNAVYYNVHGTLLLLAGFGNLRGNVEVWDVRARKMVSESRAADSTHLEWSPDGERYLTATTSPRLRVGNGYKVWHYTGSLLHERSCGEGQELWDVLWQPGGAFPARPVSYAPVPGIQPSQPQASKQAYRPPCARTNAPAPTEAESSPAKSKSALKNRKRKEAKKSKRDSEPAGSEPRPREFSAEGDAEKKARNIKKKLEQIAVLKQQLESGKTLEAAQLEKIGREQRLREQLQDLSL